MSGPPALTYFALLNTSAEMGRLPESSARNTEAASTERVERESTTTGIVNRWEVEEEKFREHLQIIMIVLFASLLLGEIDEIDDSHCLTFRTGEDRGGEEGDRDESVEKGR